MSQSDKKGSLNPKAKEFKFNPSAVSWAPPPAASNDAIASTPSEKIEPKLEESFSNVTLKDEKTEEDIDETDPLWKVVLEIAKGDKNTAKSMLEDPDSLMAYPEVVKILSETAQKNDDNELEDWEKPIEAVSHAPMKKEKNDEDVDQSSSDEETSERDEEGEEDPREHLNLVFIGHVDAGKSTLSGNILYLTEFVDKRMIERYEREAKQRNRESWFLAYIMDTNEEERAKGKTVEVGRAHFHSENKRFTILDAPGHGAYVPNMIQGAAQADVGILVISARKGEFETGFERGGQTREHALLAKTLGVRYLIVVINKMDDHTVNWDIGRFEECVSKLKPFLKSCGYAIKKDVKFIPLSGLTGANIKEKVSGEICPWWAEMVEKGENNTSQGTLLELFDQLKMDNRDPAGTLRCPVLDRYVDRGTIALSKVERGTLMTGMKVMVMPTKKMYKVESISINEARVQTAKTGENVSIKLNCGEFDVQKGYVICEENDACPASTKIMCQMAILELPNLRPVFSSGFESIFHCHTVEEECEVVSLVSLVDRKTGKTVKKPRFAKEGNSVNAVIRLGRSVSVEKYDDMPQLGRFTLRSEGKTIAIGKIINIKEE